MNEGSSVNPQQNAEFAPGAPVPNGEFGQAAQPQPGYQPGFQPPPQPADAYAVGSGAGQPQQNYGYAQPQTPYEQGQPQTPPPINSGYNAPYTGIGSPQKDKWVAVVLAFALGTLGIHKFYLGYKNEGIIMLVVSIVGAICTFGLGTMVMVVISYIEAVRYIILTQDDFQARYVIGRKGWL